MLKQPKVAQFLGLAVFAIFLVAFLGAHPLVDHFNEIASSGSGTFGSHWIHTDTSGTRYGLIGQTNSSSGGGLYGLAYKSSGGTWGVIGQSKSSSGTGVFGYNDSSSGATTGVYGETTSTSSQTRGVFGYNSKSSGDIRGVEGRVKSSNGLGVFGVNEASGGNGVGVYGTNRSSSGTGQGVFGRNENASSGWAGKFVADNGHGVTISTGSGKQGLVVSGGTKNAAVDTSTGMRLLYSEESTEVWFSDYGFGRTVNGSTVIMIDPIFAETVSLEEGYHLFLQVYGDAHLYVAERNTKSFTVRMSTNSPSQDDIEFSYRLVAKRKGYETDYLELAPEGVGDFPPAPPSTDPGIPNPDPAPISTR